MKTRTTVLLASALLAMSTWASAAQVLVVLSDSDAIQLKDGSWHPTGFFFNELMQPVKMLVDAGDTITFATPEGRAPTMDASSPNVKDFAGDQAAFDAHMALLKQWQLTDPRHTPVISLARVEQLGYAHFDAVFVPGGHAPMQDLAVSPAMGKLLRTFHQAGKTTALICHGGVALVSAVPDASEYTQRLTRDPKTRVGSWIYAGYRMTAFSNAEETASQAMFGGRALKFTPETALTQSGAKYSKAPQPWQSYVVEDRELITGQNPASAVELGKRLVAKLHPTKA